MSPRCLPFLVLVSFASLAAPSRSAAADSSPAPPQSPSRTINQRIVPVWEAPHHFTFRKESADGGTTTLRVDARTGMIDTVAEEAGNADRSTLRGGEVPRSQPSATEAHVRFENRSDQTVTLFWIDNTGRRKGYGTLAAGESRRQHTYAGHAWMVQGEDGTFYGSLVAQAPETTARIEKRFPRPEGFRKQDARNTKSRSPNRSPDGRYEYRVHDGKLQLRSAQRKPRAWTTLDLEAPADDLGQPSWSPDGSVLAVWKIHRHAPAPARLLESSPRGGGRARLIEHPYRLPGDRYDTYHLMLFDAATKRNVQTELPAFDFNRPRLHWFGDHHVAVEKIDRGHQRFRLFVIDAANGESRVAIDEQSPTFVWTAHRPPVPLLTFLESSDEVIYSSECSGYRHLYLLDLADPDASLRCTVVPAETPSEDVRQLSGFCEAAITRGDWLVREIVSVDESNRTIDLLAGQCDADQDPYHRHLMRVSFDGQTSITATRRDGDHSVQLSPDKRYAVVTSSRVDQPPVHELIDLDGERRVTELMRAQRLAPGDTEWTLPRVFCGKGRDDVTDIWGNLYFPNDFDPARTAHYPVIEAIYAGPHDSHVPKRYQHSKRFEKLTALGFVVVQIDGMGTANRSKAFHDRCWQDLKDAGFPDRIAWMKAAAKRYPALDLGRVGIFGTSAGGQNACGAVLFHGDFYRAAYASCGCHDNRMDKASWNEQWMGYPVSDHYARSSNIENADRLRGKLFLVVGELDRNVPPESTYRLVDALIEADKDFEFLMIPGMGHGDGGPYGRRRMRDFFVRTLQPGGSASN